MNRVAVYKNGLEGSRRTGILTGTATHANFLVNFGDEQVSVRHHVHGLGRTMFGTGPAIGLLRFYDAVFLLEMDLSDLEQVLGLHRNRDDGSGGTDFTAEGAIKLTQPLPVIHVGLHHANQSVLQERGLQNLGRAGRNAK